MHFTKTLVHTVTHLSHHLREWSYIGVQLTDEAREVVVLEMSGQEFLCELGRLPDNETSHISRQSRATGGEGDGCYVLSSGPQATIESVVGSFTMSYLPRRRTRAAQEGRQGGTFS